MSIRPATGSGCGELAKARLRRWWISASSAAARQTAHKAAQLRGGFLCGAPRQHRHADLARPREHVTQPRVSRLLNAFAYTFTADLQHDLQFAVSDSHAR